MTIDANSWAAGVGSRVENKAFSNQIEILERKHLLVGTYDPTITTITDYVPVQITSPEDAADKFGDGFMIHRMAIAADKGHYFDVPVYVQPVPEDGAAVQATGTVTITGPATEDGTFSLYIGNDLIAVAVANADTATDIGDAVEAAVNADTTLPVTAANVAGVVTMTSKTAGTFGNGIALTMNWGVGEELPAGVSVVIVDMASGATDPDAASLTLTLNGLGTGDLSNEDHYTDVNFGWGFDTAATINSISAYNGVGNLFTGCYDPVVARPFRNLWGDTTAGSAGKTALKAITDVHLTDRTSGVVAAPGSPVHPVELACHTMAVMAYLNSTRAEQTAINQPLTGIIPGLVSEQWTADYDTRDDAVKEGISTTLSKSGILTIQNVLTMYRPASVPIANNGYRSQRNISILQNILNSMRQRFELEKWTGVSIVEDVTKVSNAVSREKARDIPAVLDDLMSLADQFGERAWIYSAAWTKEKLAGGGYVTLRTGGQGFDSTLPVLLSGEGGLLDNTCQFDTSLAVLL